jgi:hypothetical protein
MTVVVCCSHMTEVEGPSGPVGLALKGCRAKSWGLCGYNRAIYSYIRTYMCVCVYIYMYIHTRRPYPLNDELNPIRHLLVLAGAHHFVDVSRVRVNGMLGKVKRELCKFCGNFLWCS